MPTLDEQYRRACERAEAIGSRIEARAQKQQAREAAAAEVPGKQAEYDDAVAALVECEVELQALRVTVAEKRRALNATKVAAGLPVKPRKKGGETDGD